MFNSYPPFSDALTQLIQERLQEIVKALPVQADNLTLLAAYAKEWIVYRDQIQYLPGK